MATKRKKRRRAPSVQNASTTISCPPNNDPSLPINRRYEVTGLHDGGGFGSEVVANHQTGLTHSAVWRGINYICDALMKVPFHVMRNDDANGEEKDKQHFAYRTIRHEANPLMSAGDWRHLTAYNAIWHGEAVSWIERDRMGNARHYWPLSPRSYAKELRPSGTLLYHTLRDGERFTFTDEDAFKIFGLSTDGVNGVDFLKYAQNTLNHGLSLRSFSSKFFSNGAHSSGVLYLPDGLRDEQIQEWASKMSKKARSPDQAHKTMVLFQGVKYEPLTIAPEQAQFLETFSLNDQHAANFLKLPGHIVGIKDSVSYNSLEQSRQETLDSAIDPWMCKFENEHWRKTLSERQKETESHSVKANRKALVRVSFAEQVEGMAKQVTHGMLTPNAAAKANNQPSMGPEGDKHYFPLNHVALEDAIEERENSEQREEELRVREQELRAAAQVVIANDLSRSRNLFTAQVRKMLSKPQQLQAWAEGRDGVRFMNAENALSAARTLAEAHDSRLSVLEIMDGWEREFRAPIAELLDLPLAELKARAESLIEEGYDSDRHASKLLGIPCES